METADILIVLATYILAGAVKGVVGLGLPTISLAILTVALGLPEAMAILLLPSFLTNAWQAVAGGGWVPVLRRTWLFLAIAAGTVWIGGMALRRVELAHLSTLLGLLLITYGAVGLSGLRIAIPARAEKPAGILLGAMNGVLTGMTGSFVMPGVMYLQAIGLPRDQLVQAMGMLFTISTLALAVALGGNGLLTAELGLLSLIGILPAFIGMALGQRLRQKLSEALFRKALFTAIAGMGGFIVFHALAG
jgi:hypothetical protein